MRKNEGAHRFWNTRFSFTAFLVEDRPTQHPMTHQYTAERKKARRSEVSKAIGGDEDLHTPWTHRRKADNWAAFKVTPRLRTCNEISQTAVRRQRKWVERGTGVAERPCVHTLNILCTWSRSVLPGMSGFPSSSSPRIQPAAQRSTAVEYFSHPRRSSGHRYHKVTTCIRQCAHLSEFDV